MAGNAFTSGEDDVISGINVTPLVDVVLVLLIIFLITAPVIYQSAIKVQLPKAKTGEQTQKTPLTFTITQSGDILWDKEKLDWKSLGQKLATLGPNASEETAVISADESVSYATVVKLMDTLRQAGLIRFALNVEAPAGQAPSAH